MQIKTTMKYHLTPAIIKKYLQIIAAESVEKRRPSYTVGGTVSWHSHYGKQYRGYSKN